VKPMVKSELLKLWRQREVERGEVITVAEVVKATGLSRETVTNLKNGTTTRYDAPVVGEICKFFGIREGEPVPFLVYRQEEAA